MAAPAARSRAKASVIVAPPGRRPSSEHASEHSAVGVGAVDLAFARLVGGQSQRADAARDVDAAASGRGALREPDGDRVQFAGARFEAVAGEPGGVRAEAVGFDDPRPGVEILAVDLGDEIGRGQAEFLQAAVDGGVGQLHEAGAHRPVAAEDAGLQFVDQVHASGSLRSGGRNRNKLCAGGVIFPAARWRCSRAC